MAEVECAAAADASAFARTLGGGMREGCAAAERAVRDEAAGFVVLRSELVGVRSWREMSFWGMRGLILRTCDFTGARAGASYNLQSSLVPVPQP